jgi:hypothetical protein
MFISHGWFFINIIIAGSLPYAGPMGPQSPGGKSPNYDPWIL